MRKHHTESQRVELVELVTSGRPTLREAAARLGSGVDGVLLDHACEEAASAAPRPAAKKTRIATSVYTDVLPLIRAGGVSNSIGVRVEGTFRFRSDAAASGDRRAGGGGAVIAHGLPIYVVLEPVDMRLGAKRLGGLVRERMRAEPRSRALFVFVGKGGHSMKV